ncbi:hypothetical protein EDC96DRAFT_491543 [Choanephora cucurbitarum]|nr:hypothetical protein EDC96DRAFT_491543 [Choanephora cucurbitarum]
MTTVVTETVPLPATKTKKNKKDKNDSKKKKEAKATIEEDRFKPVQNPLFSLDESKRSINLTQTPAELQGFAAQRYIPSSTYAHLDPTQHENAHLAFKQLQKIVNSHQLTSPQTSDKQKERLADGAIVLEYCRAHWNYQAQVNNSKIP